MTLRFRRHSRPVVVGLLLILTFSSPSWGQKKGKGGLPTGAPNLTAPFPSGATRGVPLEITLTGTNLVPANQVLLSLDGKVDLIADEKAAAEGKVRIKLEVAPKTPVGLYPFRLSSDGGVSNLRLFAVDDLPQVLDNDANRDRAKAQAVTLPVVIAGKTEAEQSDFYKFPVKAGQRLSFDLIGRRLGGPIDPVITLYDAKGRELAQDNDSPGCQGDPRLSYSFKEAGDYVVEVRDVLGRGGADFVYRLRIGEFPLATAPIPMAAKPGSKVMVDFAGPAVEGVKPVEVVIPLLPAGAVAPILPVGPGGQAGMPVYLLVSDHEEVVEKEPNQDASQATRIPLPGGVTGRFLAGDDLDTYVVTAKKGQKITVEAQTLELGSPTIVYLVVRNPKTKAEIAKSSPQSPPPADQRLEFTAPEDGDYLIEVQHLLFQSGPIDAYHLRVEPVGPSAEVVLSAERAEAAAGATAVLPFTVNRKNFSGPLEVKAVGKDVNAVAKVRPGQKAGVLVFPIPADLPKGVRPFRVEVHGVVDGKPRVQLAHARPAVSKALSDLAYPSTNLTTELALGVKEKAPFALAAKISPEELVPGSKAEVTVTVTRNPDFAEEVAINPPGNLPPQIPAPKLGPVAKGKTELKFPLDLAKATQGDYFLLFTGKAKVDKKDVLSDIALLPLTIGAPFELAVEPAKIDLAPGAQAKITLQVKRRAGYKGPVSLEVKNLPAKVTGGKTVVNPDQNTAVLELAAAADAPADTRDLEIVGIATGMNNLQDTAPPVMLRVGKK